MKNETRCARIDLKTFSDAENVELGDIVEIVIKGKVKSLRGPEEGYHTSIDGKKKEKYTYNGSMEIELDSVKLLSGSDFSGMEDD